MDFMKLWGLWIVWSVLLIVKSVWMSRNVLFVLILNFYLLYVFLINLLLLVILLYKFNKKKFLQKIKISVIKNAWPVAILENFVWLVKKISLEKITLLNVLAKKVTTTKMEPYYSVKNALKIVWIGNHF